LTEALRFRIVTREAISVLSLGEPDNRPGLSSSGPTNALNPVVAVFDDELAVAASDNHRRRFPALLGQLVHGLNPFIPIVLVDGTQHGVAGGPGKAMQLVKRQKDRPSPPPEF
jgi:hypothetical protein